MFDTEFSLTDGIEARPAWFYDSKCANDTSLHKRMKENPGLDIFHDRQSAQLAKAYCSGCPFRAECLALAMGKLDLFTGVMGGFTYRERVALIRKTRKKTLSLVARFEALQKQMPEQFPDGTAPNVA